MRIFEVGEGSIRETATLDGEPPKPAGHRGFHWIAVTRSEFETALPAIQSALLSLGGTPLVDLHVSDLLNRHIPSHFDYTAQYDILVFRRLAAGSGDPMAATGSQTSAARRGGPPILQRIDTTPVGFVVFDQVLLTVHPEDCTIRDAYAAKLRAAYTAHTPDSRVPGSRPPSGPADLMLRIVAMLVDGFLDLRRKLSHQLDRWQSQLLDPNGRFRNWGSLLDARLTLHYLEEICEDQRAALQDWIDDIEQWPESDNALQAREHDLLKVRSRDVLEHIERVANHVRRLEHSAETAVQLHFNAQGNRTNDIMRTLTTLTAIFLPLNLIAAIFGMNFEFLPLIHQHGGFWWAIGTMTAIAIVLSAIFWRKRYLARTSR